MRKFRFTNTTLMKHTGGTKFYEIIVIEEVGLDRALIVKRYGKAAYSEAHGGVTTVETGSLANMEREHQTIINAKSKASAKGQYMIHPGATYGIHGYGRHGILLASEVLKRLEGHFGARELHKFENFFYATEWTKKDLNEVELKIEEVSRGEAWGSW